MTLRSGMKAGGGAILSMALLAGPALAQPGPGPGPGPGGGDGPGRWYGYGPRMMMGWGDGSYGGHGWLFAVVCLFALIGLIAIVIAVTRLLTHGGCPFHRHGGHGGLSVVEERYARGEINRDEYLEKKRDLSSR
ncbi:MAG: SHOCT domain-containing protein [Gemmatimonas sp.]